MKLKKSPGVLLDSNTIISIHFPLSDVYYSCESIEGNFRGSLEEKVKEISKKISWVRESVLLSELVKADKDLRCSVTGEALGTISRQLVVGKKDACLRLWELEINNEYVQGAFNRPPKHIKNWNPKKLTNQEWDEEILKEAEKTGALVITHDQGMLGSARGSGKVCTAGEYLANFADIRKLKCKFERKLKKISKRHPISPEYINYLRLLVNGGEEEGLWAEIKEFGEWFEKEALRLRSDHTLYRDKLSLDASSLF